jgi:hypothetical protein
VSGQKRQTRKEKHSAQYAPATRRIPTGTSQRFVGEYIRAPPHAAAARGTTRLGYVGCLCGTRWEYGDGGATSGHGIHTPDHGPHALRLGHAALLQRAHRGGAKRHAAGHVATSTSRTGPRALFRRPDKVGKMGCQEFFEPYGFSFNSCARRVDDEKLIPQIGGEMADLKLPLFSTTETRCTATASVWGRGGRARGRRDLHDYANPQTPSPQVEPSLKRKQ